MKHTCMSKWNANRRMTCSHGGSSYWVYLGLVVKFLHCDSSKLVAWIMLFWKMLLLKYLQDINQWLMFVHICILCHLSHYYYQIRASLIKAWSIKHLWDSSSTTSSPSISLNLSFTLCQSSSGLMGAADRWQSHFHSGMVRCCLGAKPCKSYKCRIKSQPGRWEQQSDREASHNHHYQCLYGWHPQIKMCSSSVPAQKLMHVLVAMIFTMSQSNLLLDTDYDLLHKFNVMQMLHVMPMPLVTLI